MTLDPTHYCAAAPGCPLRQEHPDAVQLHDPLLALRLEVHRANVLQDERDEARRIATEFCDNFTYTHPEQPRIPLPWEGR